MIARKLSLLRQLAWAATLATGFGALWFMLAVWLGASIHQALQGGKRSVYERIEVRSDGTVLIASTPQDNLSQVTYRDLKGMTQEAPDPDDVLPTVLLLGAPDTPRFLSPQTDWAGRLTPFVNEREPTVNWFFVHDGKPDGAGYFAAYERTTNRRVGFIGMSGFRSSPVPAADWIPVRGAPKSSAPVSIYSDHGWVLRPAPGDVPPHQVYLPSGSQLRQADLAARTVTTVYETTEPIESVGIPTLAYWSRGHSTTEQPILVRTTRQIHELDQRHHVIKVFNLPADVDPRRWVNWYQMKNGHAIAVVGPPWSTGPQDNVSRQVVYRISPAGAIEEQFPLELQSGSNAPDKPTQAFLIFLTLPAPAIVVAIGVLLEFVIDQPPNNLAALLRDTGPSLIALVALSIVLVILVQRRSRAFGLSRRERIAWLVFVILLGLPGYVGFRLYRRWPTRQPCPNCHAPAPRDRLECAECGTSFPHPSWTGIEIFA